MSGSCAAQEEQVSCRPSPLPYNIAISIDGAQANMQESSRLDVDCMWNTCGPPSWVLSAAYETMTQAASASPIEGHSRPSAQEELKAHLKTVRCARHVCDNITTSSRAVPSCALTHSPWIHSPPIPPPSAPSASGMSGNTIVPRGADRLSQERRLASPKRHKSSSGGRRWRKCLTVRCALVAFTAASALVAACVLLVLHSTADPTPPLLHPTPHQYSPTLPPLRPPTPAPSRPPTPARWRPPTPPPTLIQSNVNVTDARVSVPETAGLVISGVQSLVFVFVGPSVLWYGRAVQQTAIFIQAAFAANYIAFIGDFATISALTAFDVLERLVMLVTATLTLTFTAIQSQQARDLSQGAVLGALASQPLMQWLRNLLFITWAGCSGFGEKTPTFPDGEPLNCELTSSEFQIAFQLTKALFWIITMMSAAMGKHVTTVALCMTGSAMLMNGIIDLTKRISIVAMPDDASAITLAIEPVRVFVGYGLAAVGVLIQRQIMEPQQVGGGNGGKPKARGMQLIKPPSEVTIRPLRCLVSPFVIKCLLGPVLAFNEYLINKMGDKETIVEEPQPRLPGAGEPGDAIPLIDATPTSTDLDDSRGAALCTRARGECASMAASPSAAAKSPVAQSL